MAEPLKVQSSNELQYYLMVTPCDQCQAGVWELRGSVQPGSPGSVRSAPARCRHCQGERDFTFISQAEPSDPDSLAISPSDEPGTLIDLDQWLALAYLMLDQATRQEGVDAHQSQIRAALCFAEAMKFYGTDDELPPAEAFFHEQTAQAFHEHPEAFARQHLQDQLTKLPPPPAWSQDTA